MQTDHRVPTLSTTTMRQQQQHRKRSLSGLNSRKRDRHDLICVVCHAPAMGYNFDQITCESCKAFFRRNALNNAQGKFKCRSGTDDCLITLETRKRCKACRLRRCFDRGLRKEWIMSEEEKRTKKQKIEDNRRLRAMSQNSTMFAFTPSSSPPTVPETEHYPCALDYPKSFFDENMNDSSENPSSSSPDDDDLFDVEPNGEILSSCDLADYESLLTANERYLLAKIDEDYARAVRLNVAVIPNQSTSPLRSLHDTKHLVNEPAQISTIRMITFFKLAPEFNSLHEDDRLTLVKYNLVAVLYLHCCMCADIQTETYREPNTKNDFCYHLNELRRYSDEVHNRSLKLIKEVQDLCANDHLIIKLAMLILIFSKGSELNEPVSLRPRDIFRAQNVFIDLLWKYFDARFDAEQTPRLFSRLIFALIEAQAIAHLTKEEIAKQNVTDQQLAPLMQSILLSSL